MLLMMEREAERSPRQAHGLPAGLAGRSGMSVPGLMEALIPRKDESHGSTEEVKRPRRGVQLALQGRAAA